MRVLIPLIFLIASCSKQTEIDYDIKIGFVKDTIYEFQELRHYYAYSNLQKLNESDNITEAKVTSTFGEFNLLDHFDSDSLFLLVHLSLHHVMISVLKKKESTSTGQS